MINQTIQRPSQILENRLMGYLFVIIQRCSIQRSIVDIGKKMEIEIEIEIEMEIKNTWVYANNPLASTLSLSPFLTSLAACWLMWNGGLKRVW